MLRVWSYSYIIGRKQKRMLWVWSSRYNWQQTEISVTCKVIFIYHWSQTETNDNWIPRGIKSYTNFEFIIIIIKKGKQCKAGRE